MTITTQPAQQVKISSPNFIVYTYVRDNPGKESWEIVEKILHTYGEYFNKAQIQSSLYKLKYTDYFLLDNTGKYTINKMKPEVLDKPYNPKMYGSRKKPATKVTGSMLIEPLVAVPTRVRHSAPLSKIEVIFKVDISGKKHDLELTEAKELYAQLGMVLKNF